MSIANTCVWFVCVVCTAGVWWGTIVCSTVIQSLRAPARVLPWSRQSASPVGDCTEGDSFLGSLTVGRLALTITHPTKLTHTLSCDLALTRRRPHARL